MKKTKFKPVHACKWCTELGFCLCSKQLGDDCEGKCSYFEHGKKVKYNNDNK